MGPEHFRAIGRIVVYQEYLQSEMLTWTWLLIGAGQVVGQILTAGVPFNRTVRVLDALVLQAELDQAVTLRLRTLLKEALKLEERRNDVVHSIWGGGGERPTKIKSSLTAGTLKHVFIETPAKDLDALADDFERVTLDIQREFIDHLKAATTRNSSESGA